MEKAATKNELNNVERLAWAFGIPQSLAVKILENTTKDINEIIKDHFLAEEALEEIKQQEAKNKTELRFKAYQRAINKIDDYFEYEPGDYLFEMKKRSYQEAREFVYNILDKLTEELGKIE
jgi:hypothetical protein